MRDWRAWLRMPGFWTGCFVVLGLGLRGFHYFRDPSMWHDEAALAVNVLGKGFREMLGPLALAEAAPPLFLWSERAASLLFGDGTYALRLVPFLASCLALILLVPVARRLLRPEAVPWVILLAACSNRLLWHSCEAKPYAVDVLVATGVLALFAGSRLWPVNWQLAVFALLAPLVIFLSYPGCFLYGGVLAALMPTVKRERAWPGFLLLSAVVGASFLLLYLGPVRAQRCEMMARCWVSQFPNWRQFWTVPGWSVFSTLDVARYCFEPTGHVLGLAAVVGTVRLWRNGESAWAIMLALPLGLALFAAFFGAYPYGGARVEVYSLPGLALLIGAGLAPIWDWLRARSRLGLVVLIGSMLAGPGLAVYRVAVPWLRADCGRAAAYVLERRQDTDGVTANHWEYFYYFRNLGHDFTPLEDVTEMPADRHWLVLTCPDERDRRQLARYFAAAEWRAVERREFMRTTVYLLKRRRGDRPLGRTGEEMELSW